MSTVLHINLRHAILALVTLALLSLPFAHRVGAAPISPQMSQYLALGGVLSDICGDADTHPSGGCESCRIVGSMLLSPAAYSQPAALACVTSRLPTHSATAAIWPMSYAFPPVRAPPAV